MEPLPGGPVAAASTAPAPPQQPLAPVAPSVQRVEGTTNVPPAISKPPPAQPVAPVGEKPPPPAAPATTKQGLTALERETALQMMGMLAKYKEADPFRKPVDWEALNIPDYPTIIKQPMDLGTVREKLRSGAYASMDAWKADVGLIWANCRKYNGEAHPVSKLAEKLEAAMERRMDEAVAAATRELAQRGEASRGGKVKTSREFAGPRTSASDDSQDDVKPSLPRVGSGARLTNIVPRQPDQARASDSNPGGLKRVASSGLDGAAAAGGGNGRAAKRKASSAPGGVVPGVDLDALDQLVNTPAARSLGARRPEQLAFLQLWKNMVSSEEAAVAEAEARQQNNKKLKRQLATAEEQIRELRASLEAEVAARRAAEEGSKQLRVDHAKLQTEHKQQSFVLEHQKQLLEQQQQVIRQVLGQKNQQQQQQQQPQQARPPAPMVQRREASPVVPQQQQPAPPQAAAAPQQQRPQPQQQASGPVKIQAPILLQPRAPMVVQTQTPQQQQQLQQPPPGLPAQPVGDPMQT